VTYDVFKSLTTGLLTGDTILPQDAAVLKSLVQYALTTVATQAESLHLMTLSTTDNVLRLSQGDYLIRMPIAPDLNTDTIDIDEELIPAVSRYLASYISKGKGGIHVNAADRIIKDYNMKTYGIISKINKDNLEASKLAAVNGVEFTPTVISEDWYL